MLSKFPEAFQFLGKFHAVYPSKNDITPITTTIGKKDDSLINKDINKYSSLEAELKKNMLDEENAKKDLSQITPSNNEDDKLSSYTIDLTSIDDEIKRHQFEEEVYNKAHSANISLKKDDAESKKKDIVKVIDSEPYPPSKPKQKKLSDTAILPIIDENGEVKKSSNDEDDDF